MIIQKKIINLKELKLCNFIISLNFLPVLKKSENELIENADEEININNINCNYILEFFGDMNNYKGDID